MQKSLALIVFLILTPVLAPAQPAPLQLLDVFDIEWTDDPQIAPDGQQVVYVRTGFDIMTDRRTASLWIMHADGTNHRPLTDGTNNAYAPRWSPNGRRLAYVSDADGGAEIWMRWMDTGQTAKVTNLQYSPGGLSWAPDGHRLAFSMFVPEAAKPFISLPAKPDGATWAGAAQVIDDVIYRRDGAGYVRPGWQHLFVVPAEGGTPRQLTTGPYNHGGTPSWTPDSQALVFSANRRDDAALRQANTAIYRIALKDGTLTLLTDQGGPDHAPTVSPDGQHIAFLGYEDRFVGYQNTNLYVMDRDGRGKRQLLATLDRSIQNPSWDAQSQGLYYQYDDKGNTRIAYIGVDGQARTIAQDVGGLSLGRPYAGGRYSVSASGAVAFTLSRPDHPADLAIAAPGRPQQRLTTVNADLFDHKALAQVEEIWYPSSFDGRDVQGWIAFPPGFDPTQKYPLLLEIHGGPFTNYGDRFSAEVQLYAAAGYVVLYTNPRGSTSYGETFGNLIHHNYPGEDYDDLMSGVNALLEKGYIDPERLFVTGGSGGGVLTSWIIGKTDRFAAAVVAKPVINWTSFALTADIYPFVTQYWFPGMPWDHPEEYWRRSPLSLVGNVATPTMLLTGDADYRTPISETEQYYQALKLRGIDAMMVRIPGASHGIAARPSHLMAKVAHILGWFDRYPTKQPHQTLDTSR